MTRKLAYILYKFLYFLNFFFKVLTKKNLLPWLKEFIEHETYRSIIINKKKIILFCPNYVTNYYFDTFFTKEPETIEWINNFRKGKKIFWDIGANIGIYSLYTAAKFKNIKIYCFEPSTSNLRILSRNISVNKFQNQIFINPLPLSNKNNKFLLMNESKFNEGEALNTFGEKFNFEGKIFKPENSYRLLSTTINSLLKNKILKIPNYIKIDVDGLEHLILSQANILLRSNKIEGLCVELNENFKNQHKKVLKLMKKYNFILSAKKHSILTSEITKFSKTYNYFFYKNNINTKFKF